MIGGARLRLRVLAVERPGPVLVPGVRVVVFAAQVVLTVRVVLLAVRLPVRLPRRPGRRPERRGLRRPRRTGRAGWCSPRRWYSPCAWCCSPCDSRYGSHDAPAGARNAGGSGVHAAPAARARA
ncbi:hypothetical protein BU198_01245, partial [Streptomyces sp. CBMA156]|nr:hypothetical protein [Streptomyces sp. CBMA156]